MKKLSLGLQESVLYQDYVNSGLKAPGLDALLDWRLQLMELGKGKFPYPDVLLERELEAVDFILDIEYSET